MLNTLRPLRPLWALLLAPPSGGGLSLLAPPAPSGGAWGDASPQTPAIQTRVGIDGHGHTNHPLACKRLGVAVSGSADVSSVPSVRKRGPAIPAGSARRRSSGAHPSVHGDGRDARAPRNGHSGGFRVLTTINEPCALTTDY